ncbi:MAG: ABC transporter permease [SAR324 cluster bacterium]
MKLALPAGFRRAAAIARKEARHILRDPLTLGLAIGLPLMYVGLFGVAIELDAKDIRIAVDDGDRSQSSRALVDAFRNSKAFLPHAVPNGSDVKTLLSGEYDKAVMVIEPQFERMLALGAEPRVQIVVDGSDNSAAGSILSELGGLQAFANARIVPGARPPAPALVTRFLYNEELNSKFFVIPGLVVVVMGIISILLTSLTVAQEWENGTMERLLATPVKPLDIVVGKLAPYMLLGFGAVLLIYLAARIGFGVPFRGSHWVFLLGCLLFQVSYLGMGLFVSVASRSQLVSMQASMLLGFMPSILLSGFIFPVESMPPFFRALSGAFPARWFMIICRDSFLRGSDSGGLLTPFAVLAGMDIAILALAALRFKMDVEP